MYGFIFGEFNRHFLSLLHVKYRFMIADLYTEIGLLLMSCLQLMRPRLEEIKGEMEAKVCSAALGYKGILNYIVDA